MRIYLYSPLFSFERKNKLVTFLSCTFLVFLVFLSHHPFFCNMALTTNVYLSKAKNGWSICQRNKLSVFFSQLYWIHLDNFSQTCTERTPPGLGLLTYKKSQTFSYKPTKKSSFLRCKSVNFSFYIYLLFDDIKDPIQYFLLKQNSILRVHFNAIYCIKMAQNRPEMKHGNVCTFYFITLQVCLGKFAAPKNIN